MPLTKLNFSGVPAMAACTVILLQNVKELMYYILFKMIVCVGCSCVVLTSVM